MVSLIRVLNLFGNESIGSEFQTSIIVGIYIPRYPIILISIYRIRNPHISIPNLSQNTFHTRNEKMIPYNTFINLIILCENTLPIETRWLIIEREPKNMSNLKKSGSVENSNAVKPSIQKSRVPGSTEMSWERNLYHLPEPKVGSRNPAFLEKR